MWTLDAASFIESMFVYGSSYPLRAPTAGFAASAVRATGAGSVLVTAATMRISG